MQEQEYSELLNETKRGLKTGENLAVKAIQKTTSAISGSNFAFSKNIEEKLGEAYGNLTEQDVMLLSSKGIVWSVSILLSMFLQDFISLKQAQIQAKLNGNKIKKEIHWASMRASFKKNDPLKSMLPCEAVWKN